MISNVEKMFYRDYFNRFIEYLIQMVFCKKINTKLVQKFKILSLLLNLKIPQYYFLMDL